MARPAHANNPGFSSPRPAASTANFNHPANINAANLNRPANINAANINKPANINAANINKPANINAANVNRPTTVNNANINKPTTINNANINRPTTINNANINKPTTINNAKINRPTTINNTNINRPNYNNNTVINRSTNITRTTVVNNITNVRGGPAFVHGNPGWGARYPYYGYHSGWIHGSWNYNYPSYGSNWGYFGAGVVTGMATWALASSLTSWGYSRFSNPYYYGAQTVVVQQPVVVGGAPYQPVSSGYNYSQPINTQAPPPDEVAAEAAVAMFSNARDAFKAGDYPSALHKTDDALAKMPNDPTLHEFRALTLFALRQYEAAAAGLYAVLTTGPGWDWTTMVGLYPSVETYTPQLRALEDYVESNPNAAAARFVLAYQYLTQGFPTNAATQLRQVVKLQPNDTLSATLLARLDGGTATPGSSLTASTPGSGPAPAPPGAATPSIPIPVAQPAEVMTAPPGQLVGTWTAKPTPEVTITLVLDDAGKFSWQVADKGGPRKLAGTSTFGSDILTLASDTGEPLVGKITMRDANSFTFQAAGGGASDPGLTFTKSN
jgi:Tetratricopeptide repeat